MLSEMLVLPEGIGIRTARIGMKKGGEDLGYVGIEGGVVRDWPVWCFRCRALPVGEGFVDCGGRIDGPRVSPVTAVWVR